MDKNLQKNGKNGSKYMCHFKNSFLTFLINDHVFDIVSDFLPKKKRRKIPYFVGQMSPYKDSCWAFLSQTLTV